MPKRLRNCFLKRASDSRRSFLTQAYVPPFELGVVFILPTAGGKTKRFFLTSKKKLFANCLGNVATRHVP